MDYRHRLRNLMVRVAKLEQECAPSAENAFYDNPLARSVLDLAESKAISNDPEVAEKAVEEIDMDKSKDLAKAEALVAPPPPSETAKKPGGKELSTLNQFVVETSEPIKGVPSSYDETPRAKAPVDKTNPAEVKENLVERVVERHIENKEKAKAVKKVMQDKSNKGEI